jgi:hypothetical protein
MKKVLDYGKKDLQTQKSQNPEVFEPKVDLKKDL